MYLVAIGWLYVVFMMAAAEATSPSGTVLGALFTFALYGALPLSIVLYIMGTPARRRAAIAAEANGPTALAAPLEETTESMKESEPAEPGADSSVVALEPDRRAHASGDPVTPVRKEP